MISCESAINFLLYASYIGLGKKKERLNRRLFDALRHSPFEFVTQIHYTYKIYMYMK